MVKDLPADILEFYLTTSYRFGKDRFLCHWLDNKHHRCLHLQVHGVIKRPDVLTGKMPFYKFLVHMPSQSCRLLIAD